MQKQRKLGLILLVGGVVLLTIVLGGYYFSQNPGIIAKWQYQRDSARKDALRETLLTASEDCSSVSPALFDRACKQLEVNDYEDDIDWDADMDKQSAECALQSFRDTTLFKLEYDGDPKSHLANLETGEGIAIHLCGMKEDVQFHFPDFQPQDAKTLIDKWHQWKHSEGNYYHWKLYFAYLNFTEQSA